jgi:hypothetical protein
MAVATDVPQADQVSLLAVIASLSQVTLTMPGLE